MLDFSLKLDYNENEQVIKIYMNGDQCLIFEIDNNVNTKIDKLSKQLKGYLAIHGDLHEAKQILNLFNVNENNNLKNDNNLRISKALFRAAVNYYIKCFTDASSYRGVSLNEHHIFEEIYSELHDAHLSLKNYRHNHISHGGEFANLLTLAVFSPLSYSERKLEAIIPVSTDPNLYFDNSYLIKKFDRILECLINYVGEKLDKINGLLYNELKEHSKKLMAESQNELHLTRKKLTPIKCSKRKRKS